MKKIFLLIAAAGLLMGFISCSDDDGPRKGGSSFTVNTPMINHMYNTLTGEVMGVASTRNKLTLDTAKHIASLEMHYFDGNDKVLAITDIKATPKRLGFYELSSESHPTLSGYVSLYESAMCYRYTTPEGIRIISTIPDVFFLKTKNIITYDDTTKATTMENVMYQFTITPSTPTPTAVIKVMDIVHAKDLKRFYDITAASVPVTVTPDGYTIAGENIATNALYRAWTDSVGTANRKNTDKYPFKTFNAVLDLEKDSIHTTFMMGSSATVVASGTTYLHNNP